MLLLKELTIEAEHITEVKMELEDINKIGHHFPEEKVKEILPMFSDYEKYRDDTADHGLMNLIYMYDTVSALFIYSCKDDKGNSVWRESQLTEPHVKGNGKQITDIILDWLLEQESPKVRMNGRVFNLVEEKQGEV